MRKIRKCRHLVRPTPKALGLTTRIIHSNETIVPLLYHPRLFSQGRLASEESDGVTLLSSSSGISSRAMRHVDRGIFWFHILKLLFIRSSSFDFPRGDTGLGALNEVVEAPER
ncbi:hypothetical protein V6N11_081219 [Hibiscus sabdariffa]|uniref:Uncharacterized protein n=1 Tax=Hibiscus sabdariffa TaxID=183260 RepID=A0ABR2QJ84_9ROSI